MRQVANYYDERHDDFCVYCGNTIKGSKTKDHVPSKILLDEPYPENLPKVYSCNECNQSLSTNELYFSCIIEYLICQSTDIDSFQRGKIIEKLRQKPHIRKEIESKLFIKKDLLFYPFDDIKFLTVIRKLLLGHLAFEFSIPTVNQLETVEVKLRKEISEEEFQKFKTVQKIEIAPEVGSRAMGAFLMNNLYLKNDWKTVHKDFYEYLVYQNEDEYSAKIIIRNFILIRGDWSIKKFVRNTALPQQVT